MIAELLEYREAEWAADREDLVPVEDPLPARLDRQLGYFGDARYCFFYFDARADGVIWNDGRTYGFGAGAWRPFDEQIAPLACTHGLDLHARDAAHALLIDRTKRRAWFAPRRLAERMVAGQRVTTRLLV